MSFLSQAKTKRFLAVHGWSGTLLGLLLYVCIFTGSIVVFEDEIGHWSQGQVAHHDGLGTQVDHRFRVAARDVDRSYYEEVFVSRLANGDMLYVFEGTEEDRETGRTVDPVVQITVDGQSGEVVERWEGLRSEQPVPTGSALRDFFVDLHVQLYLPNPYGLILVGVLGLMMMSAAISGILIHKHVFRDAFVAARSPTRLVGARDLHVLAGSWGLPFAFVLAFTGAFFGFATTVGVPLVATSAFGGDQEAMIETLIVEQQEADLTQTPTAALDFVIRDAMQRTGASVNLIQITNYDSAGAKIRLNMGPSPGALAPKALRFDGVNRSFEGEIPLIGQAPSVGNSLLGIMVPLHFGNFAGFASKLVWLGMGLAMAFVCASGMLLWTKRREEQPLWRGFRRWIVVTVWGLPFAMLASSVAYFVTAPILDPHVWTPLGFLAGAIFVIGVGIKAGDVQARLRLANAAICIALPVLRHLMGGTSWSEALIGGGTEILVIDVLLLVIGLVLLRKPKRDVSHAA
ncbi:MAG: PepSY-associated TM helix domain-containing protein, partial [Pseudomonadota bacterium]